jgi:hypothetical protein
MAVHARAAYQGVYPLLDAAARGDVRLVSWLLDHNADPNAGDVIDADTPIAAAARGNHAEAAAVLLARGASPTKVAGLGAGNALEVARRANAHDVIELLGAAMRTRKAKARKVLPCSTCGKAFACVSKLKRHSVVHTKLRPFPCSFCGKRYSQKPPLMTHLKKCRNRQQNL